jgi:hypothetical protein
MNADCPAPATLEAFASGRLSASDTRTLETHFENCWSCAEQLETITRGQLQALIGVEAPHMKAASHPFLDPRGGFAGYDVTEIAGSGAMGVVLKAHDPTLQRTVAIKVLSPSRAWDEESVARFLREARTIAAIQHDHVVAVYSAGREKGLPYLVMPFHSDGTLEQMLARTPRLPPAEIIRVGIQLARALEVTHAQGVLHRDIKPSNILLEGGLGRVRLADFGLAYSVDDARRSVAGTPQYMSPEQARGEPIDVRSDLFGLGAVLFRLATGETVYAGKSAQEVLQTAAAGCVKSGAEIKADVPPALGKIIDRLLAPRRGDRFASAADVAEALTRAANCNRRRLKRAAQVALAASALCVATICALDATGRTAIVNTLLCQRSRDGFFIRGRFGTYAELPDAVQAARGGDVIDVRFSGERVIRNFRIGRKPITIRAANGFTPVLYATNNAQAFILADSPLTLEGLTLMRRVKGVAFTPLVAAENAPIALLNCRIFRSSPVPADTLIKAGRLLPLTNDAERVFPPLVVLDSGSRCLMRNCLVLGLSASAISFRGESGTRAEMENNLFATHRVFLVRRNQGFRIELEAANNIFLSETLLDLGNTASIGNITARWTNCFFDLPEGAVVRVYRHGTGDWLRNLTWKESNTFYAGAVDFIADRVGRRIYEATWSRLLQLSPSSHVLSDRHLFSGVVIRPAPQLHATDANTAGLSINVQPQHIGEGKSYLAFRADPEYRRWQAKVGSAVREWELRQR